LKTPATVLLSMGICLGLAGYRAAGADFIVKMTDSLTFSPATLTIGQGDSVTWTNVSVAFHTSTSGNPPSGDGLWSSPTESSGGAFKVTFTNFAPSSYPYFCSFHFSFGMTGSLTVTNSAATAPPASLDNPVWSEGHFQFTISGKSGNTYHRALPGSKELAADQHQHRSLRSVHRHGHLNAALCGFLSRAQRFVTACARLVLPGGFQPLCT